MHVVDVHVICAQPSQTGFERLAQMVAATIPRSFGPSPIGKYALVEISTFVALCP